MILFTTYEVINRSTRYTAIAKNNAYFIINFLFHTTYNKHILLTIRSNIYQKKHCVLLLETGSLKIRLEMGGKPIIIILKNNL